MNEQPTPIQLSGQQFALYEALAEKDARLASMYWGSLLVFRQSENPDLLALAAHGLRELMEKIPRYLDLPVARKTYGEKSPSLKEKVNHLHLSWRDAKQHVQSLLNPIWSGTLDRSVRTFLKRTLDFFIWHEKERPTRKQQTAKVLRDLDPMKISLPESIELIRIKEWEEHHDYFERVAHHDIRPSAEAFASRLAALEQILRDCFRPHTFEDFAEIDRIIREGEADA